MERNYDLFTKLMSDQALKDVVTQRLRYDVYACDLTRSSAEPPSMLRARQRSDGIHELMPVAVLGAGLVCPATMPDAPLAGCGRTPV
jgi:hypothetical protein